MWYVRNFGRVKIKQINEWNLVFVRNIHGDAINHLDCRSIWEDAKGRVYRSMHLRYPGTDCH
jgi:hypothetical protein